MSKQHSRNRRLTAYGRGFDPCKCGGQRFRTAAKGLAWQCRSCGSVRYTNGVTVPPRRRDNVLEIADAPGVRQGDG